jgi:cobalt/nickel transport system permease protein
MNLPPWLLENPNQTLNTPQGSKPLFKKRGFISKTLEDMTQALQAGFFAEKIALKQGFLQTLDPRVKLFSLVSFLLTINLVHSLSLILSFLMLTFFFAHLSNVSPRFLIRRVGLLVLFFGFFPIFPSLFNWVRPGNPLLTLHTFSNPLQLGPFSFPATLSITTQGLNGFLLFIGRLWTSISIVTVITLTTRWNELLGALRSFFIPKIFIMTLEMTYRYIHVFIQSIQELLLARKARDAGKSNTKEQRHFVASSLGSLFGKSITLGEEVYFSMLARGYRGEPHSERGSHITWKDRVTLSFALLLSLILYAADQVLRGGLS